MDYANWHIHLEDWALAARAFADEGVQHVMQWSELPYDFSSFAHDVAYVRLRDTVLVIAMLGLVDIMGVRLSGVISLQRVRWYHKQMFNLSYLRGPIFHPSCIDQRAGRLLRKG